MTLYSVLVPLDAIGDVGYSKDFGTIMAGSHFGLIDQVEAFFRTVAVLGYLTWPLALIQDFGLDKTHRKFQRTAASLVNERDVVRALPNRVCERGTHEKLTNLLG